MASLRVFKIQSYSFKNLLIYLFFSLVLSTLAACGDGGNDSDSEAAANSRDRVSVQLRAALSGHQWNPTGNYSSTTYDNVQYYFNSNGRVRINDYFGRDYYADWVVLEGNLVLDDPTDDLLLTSSGLIGTGHARIVGDTVVWDMSYWDAGGINNQVIEFASPTFNPDSIQHITDSQATTVNKNLNKGEKIVYAFDRGIRLLDNTAQLSDAIQAILKGFSSSNEYSSNDACDLGGSMNYFFSDNDSSNSVTAIDSLSIEFADCEMFTVGNFGGATFNGEVSVNITSSVVNSDYSPLELETWVADIDVSGLSVDQRDLFGKAEWDGVFELTMADNFIGPSSNIELKSGFRLTYVDGNDVVNRLDFTRRDVGLSYEIEVDMRALLSGTDDEINLNHDTNPISGEFGDYISSGRFDVSTKLYSLRTTTQSTMTNEFSLYAPSIPYGPDTLALSTKRYWSKSTNGALFSMADGMGKPTLQAGRFEKTFVGFYDVLSINQNGTFEIIKRKHVNDPSGSTIITKTQSIRGHYRDTDSDLYLLPDSELACNVFGVMESVIANTDLIKYTYDSTYLNQNIILVDENETRLYNKGAPYLTPLQAGAEETSPH